MKLSIPILIPVLGTALMMAGCQQQPVIYQPAPVVKPKPVVHAPKPPKKDIELKEVEDENFSSDYMYPTTDTKKKSSQKTLSNETIDVPVAKSATTKMTKGECIGLIGQEKFDKYAQMYGGESAPLKKCKMLKTL